MKYEKITSAQNPKIRELTPLQHRSSYRRESGLFVVEGRREVARCINAGFRVRSFFYCPEIISKEELEEILGKVSSLKSSEEITTVGDSKNGITEARKAERATTIDKSKRGITKSGRSEGTTTVGKSERSKGMVGGATRAEEVTAIEIPSELYDKVAYRGGTEGILAVAECREMGIEGLEVGRTPLIVVLEGVEKPGNLGAVLRSADAAGVNAVILCDSPSDLYNPNVLRASTGAVFSMQIAVTTTAEAINWLRERGVKILTAQLQDSEWYYDTDMVNAIPSEDAHAPANKGESAKNLENRDGNKISEKNKKKFGEKTEEENWEESKEINEMGRKKIGMEVKGKENEEKNVWKNEEEGENEKLGGVAIVMGTEDEGLTEKWREAADSRIKIPMLGKADSLNVSVSAAVLLYEAVRQRRQLGLL